jgi:hypothetical protein
MRGEGVEEVVVLENDQKKGRRKTQLSAVGQEDGPRCDACE